MAWLRKRIRKWRRARAALELPESLPAIAGTATVQLCHPSAPVHGPTMRTVLRAGLTNLGVHDVEIRGFLDGSVKFRRNVATQYHVRVGCEASKPEKGRYEVMRVLLRFDVSSVPGFAAVQGASLTLTQEDITRFPHRNPLIWPVDFYLHEVKKDWGPGRGGVNCDNQSEPEPGDAWWVDAKYGELPWKAPGCGFACDADADADRCAEPIASARLSSPGEPLVFAGARMAALVERCAASGRPISLLVKASDVLESRPGSIRAFYTSEFGDGLCPAKRPSLAVDWTAPALHVERRPFVLEPGQGISFTPGWTAPPPDGSRWSASMVLDAPHVIEPAVSATPGEVRITSGIHAVQAGEALPISILETWAPEAARPQDLQVRFQFTAPSGRVLERLARLTQPFTHTCELRPDELGVWRYAWRTRPDARFPEQTGGGFVTAVRAEGEAGGVALRAFAEDALGEARQKQTLVSRRKLHFRLVQLEIELRRHGGAEDLLRRIADVLPALE